VLDFELAGTSSNWAVTRNSKAEEYSCSAALQGHRSRSMGLEESLKAVGHDALRTAVPGRVSSFSPRASCEPKRGVHVTICHPDPEGAQSI
jgi:hypothetical protein